MHSDFSLNTMVYSYVASRSVLDLQIVIQFLLCQQQGEELHG